MGKDLETKPKPLNFQSFCDHACNFLFAIFPTKEIKFLLNEVNYQTMRAWFYFALCSKLIIGLVCFRVGAVEVT